MEEKIIEILNESVDTRYTYEELSLKVNSFFDNMNYEEFNTCLNSLVEKGIVYRTNKNKYMLLKNSHLLKGELQVVTKNDRTFGFVLLDKDDLYISSKNFNGAVDKDIVIAEVIKNDGEKEEGRVVKILERKTEDLIGEIEIINGKPILTLDNKNLDFKVNLVKYPDNLVSGLKVTINLLKETSNKVYDAEIKQVLGHKNAPGMDITLIAHEYRIPTEFSEEILEEVKKIPGSITNEVLEKEKLKRVDLTNEEIFTIDGADTKDIDDAVSIKVLKNGNYELGVHIADVSFYVREETELKNEAFNRGNSYYLADRVIPMLPVELSNGICSLNPNVLRFAVSCVMEIDKNSGKVLNYDVFKSIIKSRIQMNYKSVNQVLAGTHIEEYAPFEKSLFLMKDLASLLRKEKVKRGYIEFDSDEVKLIVDKFGKVKEIKKREQGVGENIIEDFMIAANESVAEYVYNMDLPFIYRVHDKPSEEKLKEFVLFLSVLGYHLDKKINYDNVSNKDIQDILSLVKDKKEYPIISDKLLRCMSKAEYSPDNIGHFGLGSKIYTHFTSPIRRYSDLMVHFFLDEYVFSGKVNNGFIKKYNQKLPFITEHISKTERNADECERTVNKMKIAEYMENHIGEEYIATINGLNNKGFFVETNELISGFVTVESLKGYFTYNEELFSLTNKNGQFYRLGDKVKVKCVRASKEDRQVDFEVLEKI